MKQIQYKQLPYFAIKQDGIAADSRVRKGIAAVFGNVDSGNDRVMPGAFRKTLTEGRDRVKFVWNHSYYEVPIARIVEVKELSRDELPAEVLQYAPEATGGLYVEREYLKSQRASEVLEALDAGVITEMSFGYSVIKSEKATEGNQTINNLTELRLYDLSDVVWGMNAATVAGVKHAMPIGIICQHLEAYSKDVANDERPATEQIILDRIAEIASGLKSATPAEPTTAPDEQAEAAADSTSLDLLKAKTQTLRLRAAVKL